jgi:hypothetical protein
MVVSVFLGLGKQNQNTIASKSGAKAIGGRCVTPVWIYFGAMRLPRVQV